MARLPIPGSDSGNWGNILNDFLRQRHAEDGSLKPKGLSDLSGALNVKAFGAKGDGVTDDIAAIQAALNASKLVVLPLSSSFYVASSASLTIPADTTLLILGELRVSFPILMGQYARIKGNGMNDTSRIVAFTNMMFSSLIRAVSQTGSQEAIYIEDILIDGNRAGTTTSFSIGVIDLTGCFTPTTVRNVSIQNYTGAPGIYSKQATLDGGGPLLIENVWINPNSNSGGIKLEHTGVGDVYMHGYFLRDLVIESFGNASGIELKNAHTERFLRSVRIDNAFINGGAGIGILCDGIAYSLITNIHGGVPGGDVIKISADPKNTNLIFLQVFRFGGVKTINDLLNSYTTTSNIVRYASAASGDMIDFMRGADQFTNKQIISTLNTGTAPFSIASRTPVSNLRVEGIDIVPTASLPAAGPSQDGKVIIEDAGAGNRNLIIYAGGQRFKIDGGIPF